VVAAARHVQLRSCRGGVLHLAVARPPLVLGDTRGVRCAPYNTHYDALGAHLATAGLATAPNCWDQCATLAPPPAPLPPGVPPPKPPLSALLPEDFCPFVVPFAAAEGSAAAPAPAGRAPTTANPFPLPQAYAAATEAKVRRVGELQAAVREAALDEARRRELQAAIQAHFREWLVSSGNMRQIFDLSRLA
jgi:TBCC domain-containing protein 1